MAVVNEEQVIQVLKQCMDPDIPIDLWNLGLIYNILISENEVGTGNVNISMSLTTPGCSMGRHMSADIQNKLEQLDEVGQAEVQIVWDPKWNTNMMSPEARRKMNISEPKIICSHSD